MELIEAIKARRSIRSFKPDPAQAEHVRELIEAGRLAPSGLNLQPWRYVVIKDEAARRNLASATPSKFIAQAPVILVCYMDTQAADSLGKRAGELINSGVVLNSPLENYSDDFFIRSGLNAEMIRGILYSNVHISIDHIMLRAVDLGLATCWIGVFDGEAVKRITEIEDRYDPVALLAVGYPAQMPGPRPRLGAEDILLKTI